MRIFDLATPDHPVEIAYFSSPGAWGAQPHTDGLIYVADNARHVRGVGAPALLAFRFDEPSHGIRQVSLSAQSSVAGNSDWLTVTATTAPSPRNITGQIARVSARFFDTEKEWTLFDDGDGAGGRLFTGRVQVPHDLHSGEHRINVRLEDDQGRLYPYDVPFLVYPASDLLVFGDEVGDQWREANRRGRLELDAQESDVVYRGASALAFRNINSFFRLLYEPIDPVDAFGFASLRFAFHPGNVGVPGNDLGITVTIGEHSVPLFYGRRSSLVDLEKKEWQLVDIPLESFDLDVITRIGFWGRVQGTFYVDDLRLVAVAAPARPPVATTVLEEQPHRATARLLSGAELSQSVQR